MALSPRSYRMIRLVVISGLAPATAVALWYAPGQLWAWTLLAVLVGFTAGTINWLRWSRRMETQAAEERAKARRRRLSRLTKRPDLYGDEPDKG